MIPGYIIDPLCGAIVAEDRTVTASYDKNYVARYERYPERAISGVRHRIFRELAPDAGDVCDVGCGTGAFLSYCLEKDPNLLAFGHDISGYPLPNNVTSINEEWISFPWDVLTFFDSLEHFPSLDFLGEIRADKIIVSLPWCHAAHKGNEWFSNWKHIRPGEHIWHFDEVSLPRLFAHYGYKLVSIGNPEDVVRRGDGSAPNILTATFTA